MSIDPSAIVHESAKIHKDAVISPYAMIGANVEIGAGTVVDSHAVIDGPTKIGKLENSKGKSEKIANIKNTGFPIISNRIIGKVKRSFN